MHDGAPPPPPSPAHSKVHAVAAVAAVLSAPPAQPAAAAVAQVMADGGRRDGIEERFGAVALLDVTPPRPATVRTHAQRVLCCCPRPRHACASSGGTV
jgi:hypothetical protein